MPRLSPTLSSRLLAAYTTFVGVFVGVVGLAVVFQLTGTTECAGAQAPCDAGQDVELDGSTTMNTQSAPDGHFQWKSDGSDFGLSGDAATGQVAVGADASGTSDTFHVQGTTRVTGALTLGTTLSLANGGTGVTSAADNRTIISNGTNFETKAFPDCDDSDEALQYSDSGNSLGCLTLPEPVTWQFKASAEVVNNSTTLQNDDDLSFAVDANEVYAVWGMWAFDAHASAGFKFDFSVPAGTTIKGFRHYSPGAGNHGNDFTESGLAAMATDGVGSLLVAHFVYVVDTAGTAGTVTWRWAQNAANASDTTVQAGTWQAVRKVS